MTHDKASNQYYGAYFENAVCCIINQTPITNPITDYEFTTNEIEEMNTDAQHCASIIGGTKAIWVGRKTIDEDCDAIIDGKHTEIKYVSMGKGTYYNTSLNYFSDNYGLINYKEFLKPEVFPYLEQFYGKSVYDGSSPVSIAESKDFRHNHTEEYKILQKLEDAAREKYVSYIYNYFCNHIEALNQFLSEMITKAPAGKTIPETLVIYDYTTQNTLTISQDTIRTLTQTKTFKHTKKGLVFDKLRIQIGWQNGNGLNNPTIRVFIK